MYDHFDHDWTLHRRTYAPARITRIYPTDPCATSSYQGILVPRYRRILSDVRHSAKGRILYHLPDYPYRRVAVEPPLGVHEDAISSKYRSALSDYAAEDYAKIEDTMGELMLQTHSLRDRIGTIGDRTSGWTMDRTPGWRHSPSYVLDHHYPSWTSCRDSDGGWRNSGLLPVKKLKHYVYSIPNFSAPLYHYEYADSPLPRTQHHDVSSKYSLLHLTDPLLNSYGGGGTHTRAFGGSGVPRLSDEPHQRVHRRFRPFRDHAKRNVDLHLGSSFVPAPRDFSATVPSVTSVSRAAPPRTSYEPREAATPTEPRETLPPSPCEERPPRARSGEREEEAVESAPPAAAREDVEAPLEEREVSERPPSPQEEKEVKKEESVEVLPEEVKATEKEVSDAPQKPSPPPPAKDPVEAAPSKKASSAPAKAKKKAGVKSKKDAEEEEGGHPSKKEAANAKVTTSGVVSGAESSSAEKTSEKGALPESCPPSSVPADSNAAADSAPPTARGVPSQGTTTTGGGDDDEEAAAAAAAEKAALEAEKRRRSILLDDEDPWKDLDEGNVSPQKEGEQEGENKGPSQESPPPPGAEPSPAAAEQKAPPPEGTNSASDAVATSQADEISTEEDAESILMEERMKKRRSTVFEEDENLWG